MKWPFFILFFFFFAAADAQTFTLKSKDLGGQATMKNVLNGFGCSGDNLSPQLYWENAPAGTKSFGLTIYDQDAPTGSGWWHWIMFDIDKQVTSLPAGAGNTDMRQAPPAAIQSKTDFGKPGYGGPCPPAGKGAHRYIITVYALKTEKLGLGAEASPAMVGFSLEQNALRKASMVFYYQQ